MSAIIGYGTIVEVETAAGSGIFFELAQVTGFQAPQSEIAEAETTHFQSPNRRREFIPTLTDSGNAMCRMNYVPASATDIFLEAWRASAEIREIRATWPNGATATFEGYVSTYGADEAPVDDRVTATLMMRVTGDVTVGAAAAPTNQILPAISGLATNGTTLTAFGGQWTGGPTLGFVWQQDNAGGGVWTAISGATAQTYTLVAGNVGNRIRVVVTATNGAGSASANSAPTVLVA